MTTLFEYQDLKRIKKLEEIYFDTLDEETEELLERRIREYEIKYSKEYCLE